MSDPKMKPATGKKFSMLNRAAGGVVLKDAGSKHETVVFVVSRSSAEPSIRRVVVNKPKEKKMFVTVPSEKSLEFNRRSDEATSGGPHLFGRRRSL